ncbi:MAG: patatin-like phospholipase family protein [bacterium]
MSKVGLALGSGGPRGLAHIGVIKALVENNISIDVVAGTSAGAVVGGLYLSLGSIEQVEKIFVDLTLRDLANIFAGIGRKSGVINGDKLEQFIEGYVDGMLIEDLRIPFSAIATDVQSGQVIEFTCGSLTRAIRASGSIPGFVDVVNIDSQYLVDGGVSEPVPVRTAKKLGAKVVLAVNLDAKNFIDDIFVKNKPLPTTMGIAAIKLLRYHLAQELCREAEIVIEPDVSGIAWMNMTSYRDRVNIIARGYKATMAKMNEIKKIVGK